MALDVIRAYGTDPEKRDTLAIIEDCGRTLTWRELLSWRNKLVQVLCGTLSLSPGERVVIYAHNAIEYVVMTAALTAAGLIAIPMNWRLVPEEVAFICNDSQARAVFYGREFSPTIQRLVAERSTSVVHWVCLSEDAAVPSLPLLLQQAADIMPEIREFSGQMLYTGGTTGKPKGAFRLKGRDPAITREILQAVDMIYADHTHLACGPLYHSAPAIFAFFCQQIGGLLVIMRKFQPERALQLMVQHRVTSTFMAPTLLKMIAMLPPSTLAKYAPLVQLRNIIVAAAHCPQSLKEFIVHTFGPCLYEMYGSTELGFNTVLRPEDQLRKPQSCGQALGHVEIQLRHPDTHQEVAPDEPGILYVRKHSNMIDGYYNDPAKTRTLYSADGDWATVGDIARKDSDGFYYICDRAIDMVISGGVNIYPREIEEALHRHPAVQDIAVFGLPDDTWGEKLHAAVVLQPGVEVDAKTLISFARTVLADYKIPREFSFHPAADFPRDHAGKIRKAVLRRHFLPPAAGAAGLAGLAAKL